MDQSTFSQTHAPTPLSQHPVSQTDLSAISSHGSNALKPKIVAKNLKWGRTMLSDLDFKGNRVLVKSTGVVLKIDQHLLWDVYRWFSLYAPVELIGRLVRLFQPKPIIAFHPMPARPWYMVWNVARLFGFGIVKDPAKADVVFRFEDQTYLESEAFYDKAINGLCTDISKSRVAFAFAKVFGYDLKIDPEVYEGQAVEKSEDNGAHDGRIVTCPMAPKSGKTYQKFISNRNEITGLVIDLRTPFAGGKPVVIYTKMRPEHQRFANVNTKCGMLMPQDAFSQDEIEKLSLLARELHLDWGGMDVLRDKNDGKIYVVDVNKTDMGPPLGLGYFKKYKALGLLGRALEQLIKEKRA